MARTSFTLSDYASLEITGNAIDSINSIDLKKRAFERETVVAALTLAEWKALSIILPEVESSAKRAWEEIQEGKNPSLDPVQKVLSSRFMLIMNAFTAPTGSIYVTTGIRQYFMGLEGVLLPKREGGVTLSIEELTTLAKKVDEINEYIAAALCKTKKFVIRDVCDMFSARRCVEEFWESGRGRCRLVLERLTDESLTSKL